MKRMTIAALVAAAALAFTSCGAKTNENGWFDDFESAKQAAGSQKAILLLVTSDGDPVESAAGIKALTSTPDFAKIMKDDFVCCQFDFSSAAIEAANVGEGATEKEQKAAEAKQKVLREKYKTATIYGVQNTPSLVIISGEGYWIQALNLRFENDNIDGYVAELKEYESEISEMKALVAATKKGSAVEKVQAIDKLFSTQPEATQIFMKDLVKKVPSLDKKNQSGLVGKYIVASANSDAYDFIVNGDVNGAVKVFVNSASNKLLEPVEAQSLYYFAANIMAQSGSTEFDEIISLLEKAIEIAPESEYNGELEKIIDYVKSVKETYGSNESAPAAEAPAEQ